MSQPFKFQLFVLLFTTTLVTACAPPLSKTVEPTNESQLMPDICRNAPDGQLSFLALGDSYTIGQSVPAADRWVMQLSEMLRERGFNMSDPEIIAQTGWTTRDLADAMTMHNVQSDYDLVSLLIGVNNQFRGLSGAEYADDFTYLLNEAIILAGGDAHRVIVLSIPDWGATPYGANYRPTVIAEEIDIFNAVNKQIAANAGVTYIDVTPISRRAADNPLLIASDGLHPSGTMYTEWAELVLPAACAALTTD